MILDSLRSLVSESMTELITVRRTVQMLLCKPASFLILAFLMPSPASSQRSSRAPFHPPEGILVAGLRETATHRGSMPSLRITSDRGMPSNANFWIHLDASGHVLEVRDIQTEDFYHPHFNSNDLIEAVHKVVYVPFTRNGNPVEAWVQDTVELLSREDLSPLPQPRLKAVSSFPEANPPTNFSIRLSRSGCFGSCPGYTIKIQGDGTVSYKGNWYVSIEGEHTAHVSPDAARQLLSRFRATNFFALKSEYRAGVTDNPTYCLELGVGSRKKIVTDYVGEWVGMPNSVTDLEDAVDQATDSARWVTASSQTLAAMRDAGISPSSKEGNKILHRAVIYAKPDAVRDLLAAGAPTTTESKPKDVVQMWAPSGTLLEDVEYYRGDSKSRNEVIAQLLGNLTVLADREGIQRALGKAVAEGQSYVAHMLIAAGANPQALFQDTGNSDEKPDDQTYLMRAVESGVWSMIDDALSRPHDIHAVDRDSRSALAIVIWTSPPVEDIFPIIDRLLAAGAGNKELDRALADACDRPDWRDGLVARGANPQMCKTQGK
jgi:hypothetical protein